MPRYVALLRGINVGGHRVKMEDLRRHFAALKFAHVETFIASGNVIFDSPNHDALVLETSIEKQLARKLGFEAPTFIRTVADLAVVARRMPFAPEDMTNAAWSHYVLFVRDALANKMREEIAGISCRTDEFQAFDREIHWLCRGKISDPTPAAQIFEKLLRAGRVNGTMRNLKTVRQLAELYGASTAVVAPKPKRKPVRRSG